jgi:cytochrome c
MHMKKTMLIICCTVIWAACGNNSESKTTDTNTAGTETTNTDPEAEKGLEMVAKSDCFTCHKISEKFTGPAYTEVAAKYAGQDNMVDSLAHKIIKGGSGVWGDAAMTPHPNISLDSARAMVHYVLSLKP